MDKQKLITYLSQFVTEHKLHRIEEVLAQRTNHITVVLEDIFQPHNTSAVIRSCECFGVQNIHIIENLYNYRVNPDVALGATQWVNLNRYSNPDIDNTEACLQQLKEQGYLIAATTLQSDSIPIDELKLDQKVALCFGTEEKGLSQKAHELADVNVKIPMYGFTQSFNISVSAALFLYELNKKLRSSDIYYTLSEDEKLDIQIDWLTRIIPRGDRIKNQFLNEQAQHDKS